MNNWRIYHHIHRIKLMLFNWISIWISVWLHGTKWARLWSQTEMKKHRKHLKLWQRAFFKRISKRISHTTQHNTTQHNTTHTSFLCVWSMNNTTTSSRILGQWKKAFPLLMQFCLAEICCPILVVRVCDSADTIPEFHPHKHHKNWYIRFTIEFWEIWKTIPDPRNFLRNTVKHTRHNSQTSKVGR
jgi:hypothetical protein